MMFLARTRITILLLALSVGVYSTGNNDSSCSSGIIWSPCPGAAQFQCGDFQVPLDYANPTVGNATLAVVRLKATNEPRLGTLFVNPGGPGGSGVNFLIHDGRLVSAILNNRYDMVGWDPRGVMGSQPRISCGFESTSSISQFLGNTIPGVGVEARGNFTDPNDLDSFFSMVNSTDNILLETGQRCLDTDGAFLKYMGTTAVARDLVSLSDCIEGPRQKINYWGLSYGTAIGNYFVNMFPERVGRVVMDGIVDSITQMGDRAISQDSFTSAESALSGFISKCLEAGPQQCAFAQNNSTFTSLSRDITQLIDTAYTLHKAGDTNITSFQIRDFIYGGLRNPTTWDAVLVPQLLLWEEEFGIRPKNNLSSAPLSSRSFTGSINARQTSNSSGSAQPPPPTAPANLVISCVDSIDQENVMTQQVFEEIVRVTHEESPTFGEVSTIGHPLYCHRFPVRAVERFTGPFNTKLANPIIVVGNILDPVTPLANAQKVAAMLGSSARLLEQDGIGHISLAEHSSCTQKALSDYFLHGTLPPKGTVCRTDQALFPPNGTLISPAPAAT